MKGHSGPWQAPICKTRSPLASAKHGLVFSARCVPSLSATQKLVTDCGHAVVSARPSDVVIEVAAIAARISGIALFAIMEVLERNVLWTPVRRVNAGRGRRR